MSFLFTESEIKEMKGRWSDRLTKINPLPSYFNWQHYVRNRPWLAEKFRSELGAKYHYLAIAKYWKKNKQQKPSK